MDGEHSPALAASHLVVGLCASAGGLEALQALLGALTSDVPASFVVVMHQDPTRPSRLAEVLATHSGLPITSAEEGSRLVPGRVFVLSPAACFEVHDGVLRVPGTQAPSRRTPIDAFLRSLSEDQGANAVCVILSGTGTDGTLGLRAVKELGGLALVQEPTTAAFDGMPRSALASGFADQAVALEEVGEVLIDYHARLQGGRPEDAEECAEARRDEITEMLTSVRRVSGHDFESYKRNTIVRRIVQSMRRHGMSSLAEYAQEVSSDDAMAQELFHELLIGVTRFFRDPSAMEALSRTVVPDLIQRRTGAEAIRVWVPGCSTGEEAYSLAILFAEVMEEEQQDLRLQLFATDIDGRAIEQARRGTFPQGIEIDVSPERLRRFFRHRNGIYQVVDKIRESCIFSVHDLVRDPPFSHIDLVSCRNVLIYLKNPVQERLFPVFRYSLRPGGYLLLGSVEGIPSAEPMFAPVDRKSRIFCRRPVEGENAAGGEGRRTPPQMVGGGGARVDRQTRRSGGREDPVAQLMQRELLGRYSPPAVLVDEDRGILCFFGDTAPYLGAPESAPSIDLLQMARPELGTELGVAFQRAAAQGRRVACPSLEIVEDGSPRPVHVEVSPVQGADIGRPLFLVTFRESTDGAISPHGQRGEPGGVGGAVGELELSRAREELRTTVAELETSNQDHRAANEELQCLNEELQSSNEELETTREELQAVNEELQVRVQALMTSKRDLEVLYGCSDIATVLLDRDLCVRSFTRATTEIFHLLETDRGRPISHFSHHLTGASLEDTLRRVVRSRAPRTELLTHRDGRTIELRALPSFATDDSVEGLVVTFVDVTPLQAAKHRIADLEAELAKDPAERADDVRARSGFVEAMVEAAPAPFLTCDDEGRVGEFNPAAARLFGYQAATARGQSLGMLLASDTAEGPEEWLERLLAGSGEASSVSSRGLRGRRRDGTSFPMHVQVGPLPGEDGGGHVLVIHPHVEGSQDSLGSEERPTEEVLLATVLRDLDLCVLILDTGEDPGDPRLRVRVATQAAARLAGMPVDALVDRSLEEVFPDLGTPGLREVCLQVAGGGLGSRIGPFRRCFRGDGLERWWEVQVFAVPGRWVGLALMDVTRHHEISDASRRRNVQLQGEVVERTEQLRLAIDRAEEESAELEQMEERLAHADRLASIGTLAAGVAHEINNPASCLDANLGVLRSMLGRVAGPEVAGEDGQELEEILEDCDEGVRRITRIVRQLSSFARSEVSYGPTDMREVARTASHLAETAIKQHGRLVLELSEVPLIVADRNRLVQVVVNLLMNAAQALEGSPCDEPRVTVRTFLRSDQVCLTVSDTGPGVPAQLRGKIFEPFFTTKPQDRGTGLGLAMAAEIARWHGGEVRLTNGVEGGSHFELVLPLDTCLEPTTPEVELPPAELPRSVRVLLVDDDPLVLRGLARLLQGEGEVVSVESGLEALRAIEGNPEVDVVLCDMMMPSMSGLQLLSRLEVEHPELARRTLFVTGGALSPEVRAYVDAHPERVLAKPVSRDALVLAMTEILEREGDRPPPASPGPSLA